MFFPSSARKGSGDIDWQALYSTIETDGKVPLASAKTIDRNHAVFRAMYLDLGDVKKELLASGFDPPLVTLYADVLNMPKDSSWLLDGSALMVVARRVQADEAASVAIDFRKNPDSSLVLFANQLVGSITIAAAGKKENRQLVLDQAPPHGGVQLESRSGVPTEVQLSRAQGLPMTPTETFTEALTTEFLFASLLYDQKPEIALDIFTWLKEWSAESSELLGMFLRSSSLITLLSGQINARANGAAFVPYLTQEVYTELATAFVHQAKQYEQHYMALETQEVLTEKDIELAKAMFDDKTYEGKYVDALVAQAKSNYENAMAAAEASSQRFHAARQQVDLIRTDFEQIGIPEWKRKRIAGGILELATASIGFAAGIGAMMAGDGEGGLVSAEAAIDGAEGVAQAAEAGSQTAKLATDLEEVMSSLQKTVEALGKISDFLNQLMAAVQDPGNAGSLVKKMKEMDVATGGADLSATYQWQVYQLASKAALEGPIQEDVEYARGLQLAIDQLVVYGQARAAAQLAVIRAGQKYGALELRQQLAQEEQQRLQKLVDSLKAGEKPVVAVMQQLYQRYLDAKSSLFAALEGYRASFFYWALKPSAFQPRILDSVSLIDAGLQDLTAIALDRETALRRFSPPPQKMAQERVVIDHPSVLADLQKNSAAHWNVPLDDLAFEGLDRVRLDRVRVWLEGAVAGASGSIYIMISTQGNYLDRFKNQDYQFTAKPLQRGFEYRVTQEQKGSPDWTFDDGTYGYVEVDGSVDKEVSYAYFEPTPFGQWQIDLQAHNAGLDLSKVTRITMELEGSVIAEA